MKILQKFSIFGCRQDHFGLDFHVVLSGPIWSNLVQSSPIWFGLVWSSPSHFFSFYLVRSGPTWYQFHVVFNWSGPKKFSLNYLVRSAPVPDHIGQDQIRTRSDLVPQQNWAKLSLSALLRQAQFSSVQPSLARAIWVHPASRGTPLSSG